MSPTVYVRTYSESYSGTENRRARSDTAHSYSDRYTTVEDGPAIPPPETRPSIRSNRAVSSYHHTEASNRTITGPDSAVRPFVARSTTFEGPGSLRRDASPHSVTQLSRITSDSISNPTYRMQLRTTGKCLRNESWGDPSDDSTFNSNSSPDRSYGEGSVSPATSQGSLPSRTASSTTLNAGLNNGKRVAPPPPPSRSKKPPPPPPMKRSALSTSNVQYG